jgi:hypothetical protein
VKLILAVIALCLQLSGAFAQTFPPVLAPVGNTGSCSAGVAIIGNSVLAGTWTSSSPCNIGGTIIFSSLPASTNGYACDATDRTTNGVVLQQTASSATSATFTVRTTNVSANDVVQFKCTPY